MSASRILVTGAAGFIGSHTVDHLLATGATVLGVDDLSTGRLENLDEALRNSKFELIVKDMVEVGAFAKIVQQFQPTAIIHLAGLVSVVRCEEEPDLNHRLNLLSTILVAEAAALHGVPRVVFASSAAVYGDRSGESALETLSPRPIGSYGMAKLRSERVLSSYAESNPITTVSLRFFNVFGPRQDPSSPYSGVISIFARCLQEQRPLTIYGDGKQTRDFVAVADVAEALRLAATKPGIPSTICNVSGGKSTSLLELIEAMESTTGEKGDVHHKPARVADIRDSLGSPDHAKSTLGFRARVKLTDGLRMLFRSESRKKLSSPNLQSLKESALERNEVNSIR